MMLTSLMVMSNKEVNDHWNVPCYNHSRVSHSCLASHLLTMDIIIIINGGGNDDGHSVSKVEKTVFSWGISYFFG